MALILSHASRFDDFARKPTSSGGSRNSSHGCIQLRHPKELDPAQGGGTGLEREGAGAELEEQDRGQGKAVEAAAWVESL